MGLKSTSKPSGMMEGAANAMTPPSLADQVPAMGALEADFRGQKQSRQAAMRATNTVAKVDSEAKQTTGTPARLNTVRVDSKEQV